jgi:Toprim domain
MNIQDAARLLGGVIVGNQIACAGPKHSPRDRSLVVRFSSNAPDGFICHSHAGDDWQTCRDYVRAKLGLREWQPGDEQDRRVAPLRRRHEVERRDRSEDDWIRIHRATALWNEAKEPRETVAEAYLRSRSLQLPPELAGTVLRFCARTPWRDEDAGRTERIPALLAVFRNIDDDIITAVHRVRLDQPQHWPRTQRRMLGIVHCAAVKFGTAGKKLVIAEGIETGLAARELGLIPTWAVGSVGSISFFPVIEGVKSLTICGETGTASREAIKLCAQRWRRAWRHVQVAMPEVGDDLNDVLIGEGIAR